jgi:bifunctional non-homologous end joining protein LigD
MKSAPHAVAGLTHPERLLWPAEGVTKQGLADYYAGVAQWALPHLVGRPLSLVRCPEGVTGQCFFAKQPWAGLSEVVRHVPVDEEHTAVAIETLEGLFSLVQGAVLEIHPWGSRVEDLDRPDRLIFDLDPGEDVAWATIIEAAHEVRDRLQTGLKLESFVKTTGGKGLHVVAPIAPSIDWSEATALTKDVAESMVRDSPARFVAKMAKVARKGKIFVDYLRNSRGQTAVAAYSTRARPSAAVSTPLEWSELSEAIKGDHYRLSNIDRRLSNLRRDPWEGFFETRQTPRVEGRGTAARRRSETSR